MNNKFLTISVVLVGLTVAGLDGLPTTDTCNQQVLREARMAAKSSSRWPSRSISFGRKRSSAPPSGCESYVDQEVEKRASLMDDQMRQFTSIVAPVYEQWKVAKDGPSLINPADMENTRDNYIFLVEDTFKIAGERQFGITQSITVEKVDGYLSKLVKLAGKSMKDFTDSKSNFEATFRSLFVEPCRQFESTFGPMLDGVKALASGDNKFEFVKRRSEHFRDLAYTHKVCEAVVLLDNGEERQAQKQLGFNKQAMLKSLLDWPQRYW